MIPQRSRYRGVRSSGNPSLPWYALHKAKGLPTTHAGPFATEREAALNYDAFLRSRDSYRVCWLNFPTAADRGKAPGGRRPRSPIPEDERREVLAACRAILDDGLYPSVGRLRPRFPGKSANRLARIRGEAIEAGLIVPGPVGGRGLLGRTDEERTEVEERTEAIRKRKIARGEVPMPVVMRMVHDRRPMSLRMIGRRCDAE